MNVSKAFQAFCKASFEVEKSEKLREVQEQLEVAERALDNIMEKHTREYQPVKKDIEKIKKIVESKL